MIVRQFRPSGVEAFRNFLAKCREVSSSTPVPRQLLEDDALTEVIKPAIRVELREFATRRDAAEYLCTLLAPLPDTDVTSKAGLWTWLTLFFFDQVCPASDGHRIVRNDYAYIYEPTNALHFYRHLLFVAWRIRKIAPQHNRLLLAAPVSSLDKVTEVVMRGLFLTRIPCMFEVLNRLYWDEQRSRPRPGIVSGTKPKPGDLQHRFVTHIRQLEMTYDLLSLKSDQLIELLGPEFRPPVAR